jgi:hypothetical protein
MNKFSIPARVQTEYFSPICGAKTLKEKAALDFTNLDSPNIVPAESINIRSFLDAVENSWTKVEREPEAAMHKEKIRRMLRVEKSTRIAPNMVFAPIDVYVIDQLFGHIEGKVRVSGKFPVKNSNGVSVQFGDYIDVEELMKDKLKTKTEAVHRFMRFEMQGLVARIHGYISKWKEPQHAVLANSTRITKRLTLIVAELKNFYRLWQSASGDKYDVVIT